MAFSLLLGLAIPLLSLTYAELTRDLPNVELVPALLNPPHGLLLQPTRLYDRSGQHVLLSLAPNDAPRRYLPLNPEAPFHLPESLAKATLALADPGFWTHGGYLLRGWQHPDSHPTLAQRLASDLLLYREPPSLRRAVRERILAAQLTARYGRTQILEWYLNSADYGHYAFGAEAAARLYLNKSASEITPAEAALLAAISQAPGLNPRDAPDLALQRARSTLELMQTLGWISESEAQNALTETLSIEKARLSPPRTDGGEAEDLPPAFLRLVLQPLEAQFTRQRIERGGLTILTTLDYDLQREVACAVRVHVARLEGAAEPETACETARLLPSVPVNPFSNISASALVLDPRSGEVLAVVGETWQGRETSLLSAHPGGSLLTPFVYLAAFARGFGPASLVWDIPSPANVQNPDGQYHGPVRIRMALANDYLVPAAELSVKMGRQAIERTLASFGLRGEQVTLPEVAAAYAALAAQGVRYGQPMPYAVLRVEGSDHALWLDWSNPQAQPIVTSQLAYLINNILSDESARWPSLGHPSFLEIGRPAAVKLGQTPEGFDVWTVGYTPSRLVAVWLGTRQPEPPRLSPRLAAALWSALMQRASRSLPADGWTIPGGVSVLNVCDPSGLLPSRDCPAIVSEVFLNGNEPLHADNLYRTYAVNRETGLLATIFTPPQLIEERVFLRIPAEAQAWAEMARIPTPPTTYDAIQPTPPNPTVHITLPAMFAEVSGRVPIQGTAGGADFDHYRVLIGQGLNPRTWIQIGSDSAIPVNEGLLAEWDTQGLSGLYAVQLQVVRTDQRVEVAMIQVTVR